MNLNNIEKEVIYLFAIKNFIDEMVNMEVMKIWGDNPDTNISFNSITHQKFFSIILVDFLSCSDNKITGEQVPYLQALSKICNSPNFNTNNSVKSLKNTTSDFRKWLTKKVLIKDINLYPINIEKNLILKRIDFIKICGNISKHNFTRLSGVVEEMKSILLENNIDASNEKILLSLNSFYDWFHNDIIVYHSSTIAEFLNNIRWGLFYYLQSEHKKSITHYYNKQLGLQAHKFKYPKEIKNKFAKECYFNLMDCCHKEPSLYFEVTKYLKMRY